MIQKKYNKLIYDEASEEAVCNYSHLRCNALSPVKITKSDNLLLVAPESTAILEWLKEQAGSVTRFEQGKTQSFNIAIEIGQMSVTPAEIKKLLSAGGRFVYAGSPKFMSLEFAKKLLKEAGFSDLEIYYLSPDYICTSEIFSEDYAKLEDKDYLIIAR